VKQYKVLLVCVMLFLPVLSHGIIIDLGGSLENTSELSGAETSEATFFQQDKVSAWLEMELNNYLRLAVEGSYTFDSERPILFDLDHLSLYGEGQLSFSVGRFEFSDFTGLVLSHTLDGGRIKLYLPLFTASVSVGFSGLMQRPVSTIIMSRSDVFDQLDENIFFAPPRLVEMAEIHFPELFLRQDLVVTVLLQQDLRAQDTFVAGGETLSSQYFGVGVSGPLIPALYHSLYFYLGTGGYQDGSIFSFLTGGGLRLYLDHLLYSIIEVNGMFASGDAGLSEFNEGRASGTSGLFTPISQPFFGLAFSPQAGNIWLVNLSYSLKPFSNVGSRILENLQTSLEWYLYFRSTTGVISEGGIDPDSDELYLGIEVDGRIGFRPFSDLGTALLFGMFIPNSGASSPFIAGSRGVRYLVRLELSVSF